MFKKKWNAQAPSNIALIKYMGKKEEALNIPDNDSISYTLSHLVTEVEMEKVDAEFDSWEPLEKKGFFSLNLELGESSRFLRHFKFLKEEFGIKNSFVIRSANNFPQNCGLASSASSFAALTKCSIEAFSEILNREKPSLNKVASLSRRGSGSSCRSFIKPWCVWSGEEVFKEDFPFKDLFHMVVISDANKKKVSSSLAHKKVSSSLLYKGREQRAQERMKDLLEAFNLENWEKAFELCWAEFWDMHVLFETSCPSFGYMNSNTFEVLEKVRRVWEEKSDGPIVTMDAGPNVHFLFRKDQEAIFHKLREAYEEMGLRIFSSDV